MNFFGHAALAARHFSDTSPRSTEVDLAKLCAGAMLPDFVGMLSLSRPSVADPALAQGVAFHHRTDEAFHELEAFQRLSRAACSWLGQHDLPRGPARAAAHVGIEMLLDEVYAEEAAARAAYCAALSVPLGALLSFQRPMDLERLDALRATLLERSATARDLPPALVAERIRRSLAGRPRLATDDRGQAVLSRWIALTRPLVAAEAAQVFAALRVRLANFGGAE